MEQPNNQQPDDQQSTAASLSRAPVGRSPSRAPAGRSRFFGFRDFFDFIDGRITTSRFGRLFRLAGAGHPDEIQGATFLREVRAGLTTFATMAYIIAVNASLLSQTGGTCVCGLDRKDQCDSIPEFAACKEGAQRPDHGHGRHRRHGLHRLRCADEPPRCPRVRILRGCSTRSAANRLASPGMGLNAYFAFQVVGVNGSGNIPYRTALTAVFFEGIIFVVLALTGMRQWLVKLIPATIKTATGVGIGFFLTEIGLSYSTGIGAITGGGRATPLALGGCPLELINETGLCESGQMTNPKASLWVAVFCGGIVTTPSSSALPSYPSSPGRIPSLSSPPPLYLFLFLFLFLCLCLASASPRLASPCLASQPDAASRHTPISYFPDTPEGDARFDFFQQVAAWHPMARTLNQLDWTFASGGSHFALALFTLLYVDIIDATATLYSMVRFCGVVNRKDGDFPRSTLAYCTDAVFISIGALLGSSPVTAFIESGAGIAEGGRTGLTAIVTGLCFISSMFFAPIFASIPPWATGCTLILVPKVGCMMIRQITQINWRYIGDVLPSFIVMVFIPFSYSVAYGLIAGIFVYAVLNGLVGLVVYVSGGRIEPREYDLKEYWTWKGTGHAPWFVREIQARRRKGAADTAREHAEGGQDSSVLDSRAESAAKEYPLAVAEPAAPVEEAPRASGPARH
ncbi:putative xanthine/uracil permease [Tolypocladium ophioglossoides CBS 100239]|uniref:Putative xanthine/uracil permease n=1 Tax=Tolypocladium ophioglossoides (strain CBS 100239) TaxID=1163406 RepID=A0A0L0N3D8_TOLOC|nr:putative xanthine/uracil permease [Tolypocladium ophioglossoides CBS 100239]